MEFINLQLIHSFEFYILEKEKNVDTLNIQKKIGKTVSEKLAKSISLRIQKIYLALDYETEAPALDEVEKKETNQE